jgi:hypothetical protein
VDGLGVDLELIGVVIEKYAHSTQGIHVEMQQIMIPPSDGMMADHSKFDVLIYQCE